MKHKLYSHLRKKKQLEIISKSPIIKLLNKVIHLFNHSNILNNVSRETIDIDNCNPKIRLNFNELSEYTIIVYDSRKTLTLRINLTEVYLCLPRN